MEVTKNNTDSGFIEVEQKASQDNGINFVPNPPEWALEPLLTENNSKENEISEDDESVVSNKQPVLYLKSKETLLNDDVEFVPLETKGSGKILDTLLEGFFNDTPVNVPEKATAKEIPEVPMAVGFFDRLKYIFGF